MSTITLNLELVDSTVKNMALSVEKEMNEYLNCKCVFRKSELLTKIRKETDIQYIDLEVLLFESERTLIRIGNLVKVIPEIKAMYLNGQLTRSIIYSLASLPIEEQEIYYKDFIEVIKAQSMELAYLKQKKKNVRSKKRFEKVSYEKFLQIKEFYADNTTYYLQM